MQVIVALGARLATGAGVQLKAVSVSLKVTLCSVTLPVFLTTT